MNRMNKTFFTSYTVFYVLWPFLGQTREQKSQEKGEKELTPKATLSPPERFCVTMSSGVSHFSVSSVVEEQSHRTVFRNHFSHWNFSRGRWAKRESILDPSAGLMMPRREDKVAHSTALQNEQPEISLSPSPYPPPPYLLIFLCWRTCNYTFLFFCLLPNECLYQCNVLNYILSYFVLFIAQRVFIVV